MRKIYLLLGALVALLFVGSATAQDAPQTAVVTFDRIAHQQPRLDVRLYGDGQLIGEETIPPAPLSWIAHELTFDATGYDTLTLEFYGAVFSGLGQKIDNVTLRVNGGENLLENGTFTGGFAGWQNPDIGKDRTNGGWYWSVPPKEEAKLDGEGSGSNAYWGSYYRLSQEVVISGTPFPTATITPVITPNVTPTATIVPTITPTAQPTPNPSIPRWCREHPEWRGCEIYYP